MGHQPVEIVGRRTCREKMRATLGYGITERSSSIGLQELYESISQAKASPVRSEASDTILASGLGTE
jgi:hypothetical protein